MELRVPHMLHLFNVFRENDGKENCAQVLEEELHRMLGIKYLNDEHYCNVVSMNSSNTHEANDRKATSLGMLYLMMMIFFVPQALMSKFIMMKACLLSMMIIVMTRML